MQGAVGQEIEGTARSILPGCTSSTSHARAKINPILEKTIAHSEAYQHVDDLAQQFVHANEDVVVNRAVREGHELACAAHEAGLFISKKSKVTSNCLRAARKEFFSTSHWMRTTPS